ncbi:MAG: flagellar hook protein FlgE [Acidobacteria bacterium]|nr:flagellar hook protein FlgE [Acidobacteriota bacterium]MBI3663006.1 flagellar hook protein FlgE [Acidobacteriota bacterium]
MPSFSTPLSGLNAHSQALSVIANNLANLNTVGYKAARTLFREQFYQQIGSTGAGNPLQVGAGASMGSIPTSFIQGSIESSGVATDVAIQDDGFFMLDKNGLRQYTRAGNFSVDANGYLVAEDGSRVQGFPAVNGVVNPNATVGALPIASGQISPPNQTTTVQLVMNLDATQAVGSTFSTAVAVYDALGATHILNYNFTKTAANAWSYNITIPAADVGQSGNPVQVATGSLAFSGSGVLTSPAANVSNIAVSGLANGASNLNFTWQLYNSANQPMVTQVAGPSATSTTRQNGYSAGTLVSFSINNTGTIQGVFSNGQTVALGQIALATFPNVQGLIRAGQNTYLTSLGSGVPNVGQPGTGGRGSVTGGALELSNVDIAKEFAQLILAQRGYQANARAITTFDEVTQEAINLKR